MEIVPVIDLLRGQVVRAQRGERDHYQAVRSRLCGSSEPLEVARALLKLYPFRSLYIADLDAIQGAGDNLAAIATLRECLPHIELWLDAGMQHPAQLRPAMRLGLKCVIGSERLETLNQYARLMAELPEHDALLSLDFNSNGFIGPEALLKKPELWPQKLICMTLAKVGSYEGPDFAKLSDLTHIAGHRQLYAAGGIRDSGDLHHLKRLGVAGALLASALHDGRISALHLTGLMA